MEEFYQNEEIDKYKYEISEEEEFRGHCSNLQAWYENDYDTRLLHSNIAFPLLKELTKLGDPIAKKKYKNELASRIVEGNKNTRRIIFNGNYLKIFNKEEMNYLLKKIDYPIEIDMLDKIKNNNRGFSLFYEHNYVIIENSRNSYYHYLELYNISKSNPRDIISYSEDISYYIKTDVDFNQIKKCKKIKYDKWIYYDITFLIRKFIDKKNRYYLNFKTLNFIKELLSNFSKISTFYDKRHYDIYICFENEENYFLMVKLLTISDYEISELKFKRITKILNKNKERYKELLLEFNFLRMNNLCEIYKKHIINKLIFYRDYLNVSIKNIFIQYSGNRILNMNISFIFETNSYNKLNLMIKKINKKLSYIEKKKKLNNYHYHHRYFDYKEIGKKKYLMTIKIRNKILYPRYFFKLELCKISFSNLLKLIKDKSDFQSLGLIELKRRDNEDYF